MIQSSVGKVLHLNVRGSQKAGVKRACSDFVGCGVGKVACSVWQAWGRQLHGSVFVAVPASSKCSSENIRQKQVVLKLHVIYAVPVFLSIRGIPSPPVGFSFTPSAVNQALGARHGLLASPIRAAV